MKMRAICKFSTALYADSVEWCPHEPFQHYFVCGNYELTPDGKELGKRKGKIYLFSYKGNKLNVLEELNTPGVLDMKWCLCKIANYSILGVVNSDASIQIFALTESNRLQLLTSYKLNNSDCLLLSLDWSTGKFSSTEPNIICSDSKGNVHLFDFNGNSNQLTLKNSICAHEFETWTSAFYYWDQNIYFSGADDGILCKFDKRITTNPISKNRHDAGVTTIHSSKLDEFLIATGSYDTKIRLFDLRKMKSPLSDFNMPGPVWRLKWDPFNCTHLLAACMSEGVYILNKSLKIEQKFTEHESMAYGVDWCLEKESKIIASCSFYDKLLCVNLFS